MTHIRYFPEIDGLRAIAVLSVVLYHAGIGPPSGFVGVDVFFVISGYLITALLHREWLDAGRIDLFAFFARRFRRLFAALALVVTSTVIVSTLVLSPYGEIHQVTQSAAASLVFAANFFFQMTTGGYFDGSTELLPLLNLWSLAVEEQFYLVWPILLLIVLRFRPAILVPVLFMLCLNSLVLSELFIFSDPMAAFYQMPSRFWEFAIGGLIALLPHHQLRNGGSIAGLGIAILLVSIVRSTEHFPGIGALPAVAGAALLLYAIHASTQLGLVGAWLRSRLMVFIGLISYSLYLWHWPLLAIDRATRTGPSPLGIRVLLCVTAAVLAWFTYRFVERPFRRADVCVSNQRLVAAGITVSFSLALATISIGDFLSQKPPLTDLASTTARDMPENRFSCHFRGNEDLTVFPKPDCNSSSTKPVRVVIWGDSMALAWQPFAWAVAQRAGTAATSYTRDSCPPVLDYSNRKRFAEDMLCRKFNSLVAKKIVDLDTLILSGYWPTYLKNTGNATGETDFKARLQKTIRITAPYVKRIIVLGPTPKLRDTAPRCIGSSSLDSCAFSRREFDKETAESRKLLSSLSSIFANVTYIEPADFFCTTGKCPVLRDGYSLYWDAFHVSSTAARKFAASYFDQSNIF